MVSSLLVIKDPDSNIRHPEGVRAGMAVKSLRLFKAPKIFVMHNCEVPPFESSLMAEQISNCIEMEFVSLSGVRNIPEFLCTALIKGNRDIRGFQMEQCNLGDGNWGCFRSQLEDCDRLQCLSFAQTRCLQRHGVHPFMYQTEELDLSNCDLSSNGLDPSFRLSLIDTPLSREDVGVLKAFLKGVSLN